MMCFEELRSSILSHCGHDVSFPPKGQRGDAGDFRMRRKFAVDIAEIDCRIDRIDRSRDGIRPAATMKRVTLEMGGNDPAIVLPDVDVRATAEKVYGGAFLHAGQVGLAVGRAYVHDAIYDAFCAELADPRRLGPLGRRRQGRRDRRPRRGRHDLGLTE